MKKEKKDNVVKLDTVKQEAVKQEAVKSDSIILTNNDVHKLVATLNKIANSDKFDAKTSYWVSRFVKKVNSIIEDTEKERQKLLKKYCKKDEKLEPILVNNQFTFSDENMQKFGEEFAELMNVENVIPFRKIVIVLNNVPSGVLTAIDMVALDTIMDFQE